MANSSECHFKWFFKASNQFKLKLKSQRNLITGKIQWMQFGLQTFRAIVNRTNAIRMNDANQFVFYLPFFFPAHSIICSVLFCCCFFFLLAHAIFSLLNAPSHDHNRNMLYSKYLLLSKLQIILCWILCAHINNVATLNSFAFLIQFRMLSFSFSFTCSR